MKNINLEKTVKARKWVVFVCLVIVCLATIVTTVLEWANGFKSLAFLAYYPILLVNVLIFVSIKSKQNLVKKP